MKASHTFGVVVAAVAILLTVTAGVSYLLYRFSKEKAHNEKWEEYIDCGMA